MSDLERIMDEYPALQFWGVEVNNPHYHGHIEGTDVYINVLQPDHDWLEAALHEATHYEEDTGDCTNVHDVRVLHAEGWAKKKAKQKYNEMFG